MYNRLIKLKKTSKKSVFIFGPRGTGKTSWIKTQFPNGIYLDLLSSELYRELRAEPSRLEHKIPPNYNDWIIIDEVQKIPELLNEVHRLIESVGLRFVLTGSSARKLKKEGANLLAGRALTHYMHPLVCQELMQDFDFNKALKFGLLPDAVQEENPKEYLNSYITTYLQEEVLQEGVLRSLDGFHKFLEIASFSQGECINYSQIARESGISRKIVSSYFSITDDLLISTQLPVFTKKAKRELVTHSKFYFFDCGVYRTLRPKGPLDLADEIDGPAIETLTLQHLRAINDYYSLGYKIHYWRTRNGLEVDFVLYGEEGLLAIEVKRKRILSPQDLRGLKEFKKDYNVAKAIIFYGGTSVEYYGEITAYPLKEGLMKLLEIMKTG